MPLNNIGIDMHISEYIEHDFKGARVILTEILEMYCVTFILLICNSQMIFPVCSKKIWFYSQLNVECTFT